MLEMARESRIEKFEGELIKLGERVNYAIELLEKINGKIIDHEERLRGIEKTLAVLNSLNLPSRLSEYDKVRWTIITILGLAGVIYAIIKLIIR